MPMKTVSYTHHMVFCRSNDGFSLIDVLIGVFVTALGAFAIFSLILSSSGANTRAANKRIAANAARQEIEILRSMESYLLTNRTNSALIGNVTQLNRLPNGNGTLTISDYPSLSGVKKISVQISWSGRMPNRTETLRMTTLIQKNGLGT